MSVPSDEEDDASSSSPSSSDDDGSALDSSVLGTKEYWDSAYAKELVNLSEIGDEGTVWFGEDSMRRVVKWLNGSGVDKNSLVLDLGSGNGATLLSLACSGWSRLTGVDYSRGAVQLAANIAKRKVEDGWLKGFHVMELLPSEEEEEEEKRTGEEVVAANDATSIPSSSTIPSMTQRLKTAAPSDDSSQCPYLSFALFDITVPLPSSSSSSPSCLPAFDVILDKGTFDAISLCPESADSKKRLYLDFVKNTLKKDDGLFSITSCNWTEEELMKVFGEDFEVKDRIPFPSFQFGGVTGSTVTSIVLTRRRS